MKKRILSLLLITALLLSALALPIGNVALADGVTPGTKIVSLEVNALENPLGIDMSPDFTWAMESNVIGQKQTAYQILLSTDKNFSTVVWDSGTVKSDDSVGIPYSGSALKPETNYWWKVIVTDASGVKVTSDAAYFSTGLVMGPENASRLRAESKPEWNDAQVIGSNQPILGAHGMSLFAFQTNFIIEDGNKFSVIMGANDSRLTNPSMNAFGTAGGESYIRYEIDLTPIVEGGTQARFNMYRVGYDISDAMTYTVGANTYTRDPSKVPYKTMLIPVANISATNMRDELALRINVTQSSVTINLGAAANPPSMAAAYTVANGLTIDGVNVNNFATNRSHYAEGRRFGANNHNVSPVNSINAAGNLSVSGTNHDHPVFPYLNEIGFQVEKNGDFVRILDCKVTENGGQAGSPIKFSTKQSREHALKFRNFDGLTVRADNELRMIGSASNSNKPQYLDPSNGSLNYLRTEFSAAGDVVDAKLYVTALGGFEMHINGQRVGEDYFNPGSTVYRHQLSYNTYDVTNMISTGNNAIGAILNEGFWSGYISFTTGNRDYWGAYQGLLAKIVIKYANGTSKTITTNTDDWKLFKDGPVRYASLFQGEYYDARKEAAMAGWTQPGFNDSAWKTPEIVGPRDNAASGTTPENAINPQITAKRDRPIQPVKNGKDNPNGSSKTDEYGRDTAIRTIEARNTPAGTRTDKVFDLGTEQGYVVDKSAYIYDMGNTLSGVPSITIPAGWLKEGDVVVMHNAEFILPGNEYSLGFGNAFNDTIVTSHPSGYNYADLYGPNGAYHRNGAGKLQIGTQRLALNKDFYVASKADESRDVRIEPQNTYRSFRFLQVWIPRATQALPLANVQRLVLSSDHAQEGTYVAESTDNTGAMVTQLSKNIHSGQLGNMFSIPTDCAQRNERMGWTGDTQAYSRTSTYYSDVQAFFRQWMVSLRNDQDKTGGTWDGSIGQAVPRQSLSDAHSSYGGTAWEAAVVMVPYQIWNQFGDTEIVKENFPNIMRWLTLMDRYSMRIANVLDHPGETITTLSSKTTGHGDWVPVDSNTPQDIANNGTYIRMVDLALQMAEAIGNTADADTLRTRLATLKREYNLAYIDPATGYTRRLSGSIAVAANWSNVAKTATNYFVDSQGSYAIPVNYDILADDMFVTAGRFEGLSYKEAGRRRLAELAADPRKSNNGNPVAAIANAPAFSITTGFSTTPNVLPGLTSSGYTEAAYAMLSTKEYASWLYPLTMGATTQWERWNSYEMAMQWSSSSQMNSFNHFALGSMAEWLFEFSAGIVSNDVKGYKNFVLQPVAGGTFTKLDANYKSNYGNIDSIWTAKGNGTVDGVGKTVQANEMTSYTCTVPANTTATIYFPAPASALSGFAAPAGLEYVGMTTNNGLEVAEFKAGSGGYTIEVVNGKVVAKIADGYTVEATVGVKAVTPKIVKGADANFTVYGDFDQANVFAIKGAYTGTVAPTYTALNGLTVIGTPKIADGVIEMMVGKANAYMSGVKELVTFTFPTTAAGSITVNLTTATVSGATDITNDDSTYEIPATISPASATVTIYDNMAAICDLNGDGKVSAADLSLAMKYYGAASGDSNWAAAQKCDVTGDGLVDMADLIMILGNYTP